MRVSAGCARSKPLAPAPRVCPLHEGQRGVAFLAVERIRKFLTEQGLRSNEALTLA